MCSFGLENIHHVSRDERCVAFFFYTGRHMAGLTWDTVIFVTSIVRRHGLTTVYGISDRELLLVLKQPYRIVG